MTTQQKPFAIKNVYDYAEPGEVFIKPFETYGDVLFSNYGRVFDLKSGQMMVKTINPNPRSAKDDLYIYQVPTLVGGTKYLHEHKISQLYDKYMTKYNERLWEASAWYELLYKAFM